MRQRIWQTSQWTLEVILDRRMSAPQLQLHISRPSRCAFQAATCWPADPLSRRVSFHHEISGTLTELYSGGMRGIVILEVLRRVQKQLGGQIQFQEFFDLIVGTRWVYLFRPTYGRLDVLQVRVALTS